MLRLEKSCLISTTPTRSNVDLETHKKILSSPRSYLSIVTRVFIVILRPYNRYYKELIALAQ